MTGKSIFLSYRREDTAGEAGRLAEHLARRFGAARVFFDIDAIAPGTDFVNELDRALGATGVVIVMIGRQWLAARNPDGTRRLDDPGDFVHREIATALRHGIPVIPILVENVSMPTADVLPPQLTALATRQAMSVQHEEFGDDAQRVADAVARLLGEPPIRETVHTAAGPRRGVTIALAVAATLAAGFFVVRWQRAPNGLGAAPAVADSARGRRQQEVNDLVAVATQQGDRYQLAEALATLERAVAIDADVRRATALQEELAMRWIRDLKVGEGQTFTDAMARPLAVLDRAAPFATGARQGDLLAHLGWAMFLRWRDRNGSPPPTTAYERALAADSINPFANAMMGHWVLSWENGPNALDRARRYFRVAADARRETADVRRIQLAALGNDRSVESRLETVRVLNEMRARGEPRPSSVSDAWSIYYFALNGQASLTVTDLMKVLPPSDHLQTYQWAFEDYARQDDARTLQVRFYTARLRAEAGDLAPAVDSLRALRQALGNSGGMLRDAVDAALAELTRGKPVGAPR